MEEFKRSLKYLLAVIDDAARNPKNRPSAIRVAQKLEVNRTTVSRNLSWYQLHGFLDGDYRLTQLGKEWLDSYTQRKERLESWLVHNGIDEETAGEDAFEILNHCSDEVISLLCKGGRMCKECDQYPQQKEANWFGISGEKLTAELGKYFPDGTYPLHFAVYKEETEKSLLELSMANSGFEAPAVLKIEDGTGTVCLKRKTMRQQSAMGQWYRGMLAVLKYEQDALFREAVIERDTVFIPLSAFRIVYEKECRTVRGMARVLMSCTAGEQAMPESSGLLEFKLWRA